MAIAINIGSDDPKTMTDYYKELLGEPLMEGAGYASWDFGGNLITVGPHDEVSGKNPQPGRMFWSILTPDATADFERYKAAGAIVVRDLYRDKDAPQFLIATFADPDNNYFQIVTNEQQ